MPSVRGTRFGPGMTPNSDVVPRIEGVPPSSRIKGVPLRSENLRQSCCTTMSSYSFFPTKQLAERSALGVRTSRRHTAPLANTVLLDAH